HWDLIGKTWLWFTISGVTVVIGMLALAVHGFNYGIDFTGGSLLRYEFAVPLAANDAGVPDATAKIRQVLDSMNLGHSEIQLVGNDEGQFSQLYLRTPPVANDEEAATRSQSIVASLEKTFPDKGKISDMGRETVGPVVGEELRNQSILALAIGYLLILIYITIRYEIRFGIAAIISLLHDILVVLGCMALFKIELNSAFVAALLTVLGYSNHDTVVIMDRIRENMRVHRRATFAETVNASLLEVMARSVNLVVVVLFTVVSLLVFGGEAIRGFSFALLIGISTGCYSSIFTASPILVILENRAARNRANAVATSRSQRVTATVGNGRPRSTAAVAEPAREVAEGDAGSVDKANSRKAIERLQREEIAERQEKALAELDAKRDERRERRKREKERAAKQAGKPKRRF
ncbi:protein translocase subunit SecF, partial [bacterium]|nr:protein translocase subunit SecF [bacterium]